MASHVPGPEGASPSPPTAEAAVETAGHDEVPPHRSHDAAKNVKRSDPFQFGSRFLTEDDDVFEFNAWDHVETDEAYKEYAESQFAMQRQAPVSDFDKSISPSFSFRFRFLACAGNCNDDYPTKCIVHLNRVMKTSPSLVFRSHLNCTSPVTFCHEPVAFHADDDLPG